jgi:alpha-L-fucosidase
MLLNYGTDKNGDFSAEMYKSLSEIATWMKLNGAAIKGAGALDSTEFASVPATAAGKHRYLFLLAHGDTSAVDTQIIFQAEAAIKKVSLLGREEMLVYKIEGNKLTVTVPAALRTLLPDVVDVEIN